MEEKIKNKLQELDEKIGILKDKYISESYYTDHMNINKKMVNLVEIATEIGILEGKQEVLKEILFNK